MDVVNIVLFISCTGEHRKTRVFRKARIAGGQLAEIEKRTAIRAN